jgi:hypothetical protein
MILDWFVSVRSIVFVLRRDVQLVQPEVCGGNSLCFSDLFLQFFSKVQSRNDA